MIEFLLDIPLNKKNLSLSELFIRKPVIELHFRDPVYEFLAWGDPISEKGFGEKLSKNLTPDFILNNIYGHYYYVLLNITNGQLFIGNSMFSILPVYYYRDKEKIVLSENAINAGKHLGLNVISNRFLLETLLFNYPLFNNSIFEEIILLPSNSYIQVTRADLEVIKHTHIEQYFDINPIPWSKSVNQMADKFVETVSRYLPENHYTTSLTGGFDGRTLSALGLYHKKNFSAYSFGRESSRDVEIAASLSERVGIPFIKVKLDKEYILKDSLECGRGFIENSSGTATFARAHYLHAAKTLTETNDCIVTGNFGSEIFRAAHVAGVVISPNLYHLFNETNPEKAWNTIENSIEFRCINNSTLRHELKELKDSVLSLPAYAEKYLRLTQNQQFYAFVFEELFRKYFGAEMVSQFRYLKNRTPFLDMEFLMELFKTGLAGIHSGYFEHNPLRRYKGQILYAHIIRRAYPILGKMMTDKGYTPENLLSFYGKISIAKSYLEKKFRKLQPDVDPYGVGEAWENNKGFWLDIQVATDIFDLKDRKSVV